jgi:transposase-like protein
MSNSADKKITSIAACFLEPSNSTHRQYEALRAYYVEGLPSAEAARRFGYTPGSFRVLCHAFRQHPHRAFFRAAQKGPAVAPKRDRVREQVICLRKQNLSIYDISQALEESGHRLSPAAVSHALWRAVSVPAHPGSDPLRSAARGDRLPGLTEGPAGAGDACAAGLEAVRQCSPQPCHEPCV